jgi:hypothetical protein
LQSNGLIIGLYDSENGQLELTTAGQNFNNRTKGKLADLTKM